MEHTDPMLAKVRKLLAQAESPACTPAEAEAFTAKAASLVARYGIDEALVAVADPEGAAVGDRVLDLHPPYAREKASMGSAVARALRCRAVLRERRRYDERWQARTEVSLHLFGHDGDLRAAELVLTSLLVQGAREVARTAVPRGEHVAAFRRTWWLGFGAAIGARLRAAERQAAAQAEARFAARGTSAAVVLVGRADETEAAMRAAYPRLGNGGDRRLSGRGADRGWTAGQQADLGGERLGRGPRGEIA